MKIPKKNDEITASNVRLIGQDGEMLGIFPFKVALSKARALKLDLLEIVPHSQPPVCKILDFGRYKYDAKKKEADAKQKTHKVEQKEIKMRPNIEIHDYKTKLKRIQTFIEHGDRVIVVAQLKGRQRATPEKARELLLRVQEDLQEIAVVLVEIKLTGNSASVTFAPKK